MLFKKNNCFSLILILIFIPINNLLSQKVSWKSSGPYLKLRAEGITYFHSNPNIMLTGKNGVIYKSTDAGETWVYHCFFDKTISTIVIDPFLENVIYIGTSSGIYKSENNGNTWIKLELGSPQVNTIAIDKTNPDVIYTGVGKRRSHSSVETTGIFKSTDGGGTWMHIYTGEIDCVNDIIIDSDDSSTIYACIASMFEEREKGGFLKSSDGGNSWDRLHISGNWYPESKGIIQSSGSTNELYCMSTNTSTTMELYKSSNKGRNWTRIDIPDANQLLAFVPDPQNSNIIYIFGSDGVLEPLGFYKSTNKGDNWIKVGGEIPYNIKSMLINPDNSKITIVSNSDGILQSNSGGSTWKISTVNSYITDIAIHPYNDDTLFTAIAGEKLFKSNDGNNSWEEETSSSVNDNMVTFCPADPKLVVAAGDKYSHKSTNGGNLFKNTYYEYFNCDDSPCDSYPEEILFEPESKDNIILGTSGNNGVLAMSTNDGRNWGYINFSTSTFVFDPDNSNNIYVGTKNDGGIYKVEDIWTTNLNIYNLTPSSGIGDVNDIAVDKNSNLFVAATDGLWNWDGANWSKYMGLPNDEMTAVLLNENETPTNLYVGTENNGVYLSIDMGISWTEFNNELGDLTITKLAISYYMQGQNVEVYGQQI